MPVSDSLVSQVNPASVYLSSLAPSGRRSMGSLLKLAAGLVNLDGPIDALPWESLHYADLMQIRAALQAHKSMATINATLAALKGVLKSALLLGIYPAEELQRIRAIPRVRGKQLPAGRSLTKAEVSALLRVCKNGDAALGARDRAMLVLMLQAGLRRSEVVGLDMSDYHSTIGQLCIRSGKGGREREMRLPKSAREAMKNWLAIRGRHVGPMFHGINGNDLERRLSSQALYEMLRRRCREAKIKACSPHDLRRTFITRLLDMGVDINTTRQLAGHEDIQTTARYDRRRIEAHQRILARLQL